MRRTISNVNVRNGAGTSSARVGSLTKGQEVVKIGEKNGNSSKTERRWSYARKYSEEM